MGVRIQGTSELVGVGAEPGYFPGAAHVQTKPIPYYAYNHYRASGKFNIVALQATGSSLLELKNGGGDGSSTTTPYAQLVIITRMRFSLTQRTATAAAQELVVELHKTVNHRTLATSNILAVAPSPKRTPPPGFGHAELLQNPGPSAYVQQVTAAGSSGGMVAGAYIKEGAPFPMTIWAPATLPTGAPNQSVYEMAWDELGTSPYVLSVNEGLALENPAQFPNPGSLSLMWDFSWAEVPVF